MKCALCEEELVETVVNPLTAPKTVYVECKNEECALSHLGKIEKNHFYYRNSKEVCAVLVLRYVKSLALSTQEIVHKLTEALSSK